MRNLRSVLSTASAMIVLVGGSMLSRTASAATVSECTDNQIDYAITVLDDVCGVDEPGSITITCTGSSVKVNQVSCD